MRRRYADPAEGLDMLDDPAFRPIEEFMPPDERDEWIQYVAGIEATTCRPTVKDTMQNQVTIHDEDPFPFLNQSYQDAKPDAPKPTFASHKVYKIRNKQTGMFSDGSRYVYWSVRGREWKTLGPIGTHLSSVCDGEFYGSKWNGEHNTKFEDIEIVSYNRTIVTHEYKADDGVEYVKGVMERKNKRLASEAKKKAKYKLAQAQKELQYAQAKLNQLKG